MPGIEHKTEAIEARVDSALKARAEEVLEGLGMDASAAIGLLYEHLAARKELPFEVRVPNATSRRVLREAEEGKNLVRFANFDDFTKAMMGE